MSMSLAPGDILQVTAYCEAPPQAGLNVRHYRVDNMVNVATPGEALIPFIATELSPFYAALLGEDAIFCGAGLRNLTATNEAPIYSSRLDTAGTVAGDLLPREVAGLISLRSNLAGRSGRGRVYVPFPAESVNDVDGEPTVGYVTDLQSYGTFLASNLTYDPAGPDEIVLVPIIFSSIVGPPYPVVGASIVRRLWASMRSRGDYAAHNLIPF